MPLNQGSFPVAAIFTFAALVIVLCLIVFFVRRRRQGAPDAPDAPPEKEVVEAW